MVEASNEEYLDNTRDEFKDIFDTSIEQILKGKGHIGKKDGAQPVFINPQSKRVKRSKLVEFE